MRVCQGFAGSHLGGSYVNVAPFKEAILGGSYVALFQPRDSAAAWLWLSVCSASVGSSSSRTSSTHGHLPKYEYRVYTPNRRRIPSFKGPPKGYPHYNEYPQSPGWGSEWPTAPVQRTARRRAKSRELETSTFPSRRTGFGGSWVVRVIGTRHLMVISVVTILGTLL